MTALAWLRTRRMALPVATMPAPPAPAPVDPLSVAQPAVWENSPLPGERHRSYCGFCGFKPCACWDRYWGEVA